jgi:aspartyl-tRNA(Asn)/glutamyl-tRNA(Gln) amidotransferase subunit A
LSQAGATIVDADLPMPAIALELAGTLIAAEAYATWKDVIEAAPDKMFKPILQRFRSGANVLAVDYIQAWQRLDVLRAEWESAIAPYDAVILPTSAILPPNAARLLSDEQYFSNENLLALRNTRIGNLVNVCGVTLPTGVKSTGISLWARAGHDFRLMRVAAAVETALA